MIPIRSLLLRGTNSLLLPLSSASVRNSHSNIRLTASPRVALNDVVPRIRVEGVAPKTAVTLRAEMFDDNHKQVSMN